MSDTTRTIFQLFVPKKEYCKDLILNDYMKTILEFYTIAEDTFRCYGTPVFSTIEKAKKYAEDFTRDNKVFILGIKEIPVDNVNEAPTIHNDYYYKGTRILTLCDQMDIDIWEKISKNVEEAIIKEVVKY